MHQHEGLIIILLEYCECDIEENIDFTERWSHLLDLCLRSNISTYQVKFIVSIVRMWMRMDCRNYHGRNVKFSRGQNKRTKINTTIFCPSRNFLQIHQ